MSTNTSPLKTYGSLSPSMTDVAPIHDSQTVWHSTMNEGEWLVQVQRGGRSGGRLLVWNVTDQIHPILDEDVRLAYGAIFGPDASDVEEWQHMAIDAVDYAREAYDA